MTNYIVYTQFIEFSRHVYWSGELFPSQGHLPNPGIEPGSPTFQAEYLPSESPGKPDIYLSIHNLSIYI